MLAVQDLNNHDAGRVFAPGCFDMDVVAQYFLAASASLRGPAAAAMLADPIEDFRSAMAAAGLAYDGEIRADGNIQRFCCSDDKKGTPGYYALHMDGCPAGMFGHYRLNMKGKWKAAAVGDTKADLAQFTKMREEAKARADEKRAKSAALAEPSAGQPIRQRPPIIPTSPASGFSRTAPRSMNTADLVIAVLSACGAVRRCRRSTPAAASCS